MGVLSAAVDGDRRGSGADRWKARTAGGALVGVAGALVVVAGAGAGAGPLITTGVAPPLTLPPTSQHPRPGTSVPPPRAHHAAVPGPTAPRFAFPGVAGLAIAAAVLLVALAALWRRHARVSRGDRRLRPEHVAATVDSLGAVVAVPATVDGAALREAIEALDAERDPRQGVLACWLRLEETVAAAGAARSPAETSGQLAERVLACASDDAAGVRSLHQLYRRARYSSAEVPPTAREEARSALAAIEAALRGSAAPEAAALPGARGPGG